MDRHALASLGTRPEGRGEEGEHGGSTCPRHLGPEDRNARPSEREPILPRWGCRSIWRWFTTRVDEGGGYRPQQRPAWATRRCHCPGASDVACEILGDDLGDDLGGGPRRPFPEGQDVVKARFRGEPKVFRGTDGVPGRSGGAEQLRDPKQIQILTPSPLSLCPESPGTREDTYQREILPLLKRSSVCARSGVDGPLLSPGRGTGARGCSVALLVVLLDPLGRDRGEPAHKRRAVDRRES